MAYVVKAGSTTIIDSPGKKGYELIEPTIENKLNEPSTFTFTVPSNHPEIDSITTMNTIITVYDDDSEIFRGRVIDTTRDFYNDLEIYCEGTLGFLEDSILPPFVFVGTVETFISQCLDFHNEEVDDSDRKIYCGNIVVTDTTGNITRSSESAMTILEAIESRIIDEIGGYLFIRRSAGLYYLDYYEEIEKESSGKAVQYGINLEDIEEYMDCTDVITCLIPYGATISEGENEDANNPYVDLETFTSDGDIETYSGNRITIKGIPRYKRHAPDPEDDQPNGDALWTDDEEAEYDSELDELSVQSADGIAMWGKIWGTATYDDLDEVGGQNSTGLYSAAYWDLQEQIESALELTLTALDMHYLEADIGRVEPGDWVRVKSTPHNYDALLMCSETHIELREPENDSITLGHTGTTLTGTLTKLEKL